MDDEQDQTPGTILLIRLRDFMNFRNFSVQPNKGFNFIVGPNGSGKSTLVTAIIVGLGGDIHSLKRQKNLSQLVNSSPECEDAEIALKLRRDSSRPGPKVIEIRCRLSKRENAAKFFLNGHESTREKIVSIAKRLQIQTNNLCQFLPQDVVRAFPEMSPREIFLNTLRAVGDQETIKLEKSLAEAINECKTRKESITLKTNTLKALEQNAKQTENIRSAILKADALREEIQLFEKCEGYMRIVKFRDKLKEKKAQELEMEKQQKTLGNRMETIMENFKAYEEERCALMEDIRAAESTIREFNKTSNKRTLEKENLEKELRHLENDIESLRNRMWDREEEIKREKTAALALQNQLAGFDESILNSNLQKAQELLHKAEMERDLAADKLKEFQNEQKIVQNRLFNLKQAKSHLSTEDQTKLNVLRTINMDAYKAVVWLRNNRDSFPATKVHEPIMMMIKLGDPSYGLYLEKIVGAMDLEAFVCESSRDTSALMNQFRETMGLRRINGICSSTDDTAFQRRQMKLPEELSDALIDFLDGMVVECPKAVRAHLKRKFKVHDIPVFSEEVDASQVQKFYSSFFIENVYYRIKHRSKYSSNRVFKTVEDCSFDPCRHFPMRNNDDEEVNQLEESIVNSENDLKILLTSLKEADDAFKEKKALMNLREKDVKRLMNEMDAFHRLKNDIQLTKNRIHFLEKSPQGEKEAISRLQLQKAEKEVEKTKADEKLLQLRKEEAEVRGKVERLHLDLRKLEDKYGPQKEEKKEVAQRLYDVRTSMKEIVQEIRNLYLKFDTLHKKLNIWVNQERTMKISEKIQITEELKISFRTRCPKTLNDVSAQLSVLRDEVNRLPTFSAEKRNEALEATRKVDDASQALAGERARYDALVKEIEDQEKELLDKVNDLINTIDSKFGCMMEKLGYAGSVVLEQGAGTDFKSFGVKILAKFKRNAALSALAPNVQSGGEKSVITALYMMALQEITKVPFRCVDEINQGMDETNERAVWGMLLDTSTKYSAQYFYLAPKFPRNLAFTSHVNVIICFSGAVKKNQNMKKRRLE